MRNACGLNAETVHRYAEALSKLLDASASASAAQIRFVAMNYHADHALVAALSTATDPAHTAAWASWLRQVLGVLRRAGLSQTLPSFRHQSRLSSWA